MMTLALTGVWYTLGRSGSTQHDSSFSHFDSGLSTKNRARPSIPRVFHMRRFVSALNLLLSALPFCPQGLGRSAITQSELSWDQFRQAIRPAMLLLLTFPIVKFLLSHYSHPRLSNRARQKRFNKYKQYLTGRLSSYSQAKLTAGRIQQERPRILNDLALGAGRFRQGLLAQTTSPTSLARVFNPAAR